jgi:Kef-type K+ transport system membrane component KefB
VLAEMAAGVILGPAVLGTYYPEALEALFPARSVNGLNAIGECGVVLFVFLVGAEIRGQFRTDGRMTWTTPKIALAGFCLPFGLGMLIAPLMFPYAPKAVEFWPFALFIGLVLSTTAVPVMGRILKERDEVQSDVGTAALSAATLTDVIIWMCFPPLLAASKGHTNWQTVLISVVESLVLGLFVYRCVRPALVVCCAKVNWEGDAGPFWIGALCTGAIFCAAVSNWMGFNSLYGAILFGLAIPRDERILRALERVLMPVTASILLPCFFVSAGLSTGPTHWHDGYLVMMVPVLIAGIAGKVLGGAIGARLSGRHWRSAMLIGALLNTRGMMEVVIAKMGMDAGLIGNDIFSIFLLFALITTAMTAPLLNLMSPRLPKRVPTNYDLSGDGDFPQMVVANDTPSVSPTNELP